MKEIFARLEKSKKSSPIGRKNPLHIAAFFGQCRCLVFSIKIKFTEIAVPFDIKKGTILSVRIHVTLSAFKEKKNVFLGVAKQGYLPRQE
jgi:hypothetical protein